MSASYRFLPLALIASAFLASPLAFAQPAPAGGAAPAAAAPAPKAGGSALTGTAEGAQKLIASAMKKMKADDVDGAENDLSQALKLNPTSTGAYVLRASIYCQKKKWPQAEADFQAASKIAPTNVVLKFNLIEVRFMQKQYDAARPGFAALTKDPDVAKQSPEMVDFAAYKVFLCDLFGGHLVEAKKELDVFNDAMSNPSYYFANASWELVVNRKIEPAREWLMSASRIYPPTKNAYYAQTLRDLGYLPIPGPNDVVTPPTKSAAPKPATTAAPAGH